MARIYEDFVPELESIHEEKSDTIIIHLPPGFKKEHLKAQRDNRGNLNVTGALRLDRKRWSRFQKHFRIPDDCDAAGIRARLDNNRLLLMLPKIQDAKEGRENPDSEEEGEGDEREGWRWGKLMACYALAMVVGIVVGLGIYTVWENR